MPKTVAAVLATLILSATGLLGWLIYHSYHLAEVRAATAADLAKAGWKPEEVALVVYGRTSTATTVTAGW